MQEVGLRLASTALWSSDEQDVRAWCFRVARNLLIDSARRPQRLESLELERHDRADGHDVALVVENRDYLFRVAHAMAQLRESDRRALQAPQPVGLSRKEAVKLNVRRLRARERLVRLVGGVSAALLGWRHNRLVQGPVVLSASASLLFLVLLPAAPAVRSPLPTIVDAVAVEVDSAHPERRVVPEQVRRPLPTANGALVPPAAPVPGDGSAAVEIRTPTDQTVLRVLLRERAPDERDALVCVRDVPIAGQVCVQDQDATRGK